MGDGLDEDNELNWLTMGFVIKNENILPLLHHRYINDDIYHPWC